MSFLIITNIEMGNSNYHIEDFSDAIKIMEDEINAVKDRKQKCNNKHLSQIDDIIILILLPSADLFVGLKYLDKVESKWEKMFFTKNIYLTIYETIETYSKYNEFLYNCTKVNVVISEEFKEVGKVLKEFKKKYNYNKINRIRNKISAHIDIDFFLNNDSIDEEYEKVKDMAYDFGEIFIGKVIDVLERIINHYLTQMLKIKDNI